MSKKNGREAGPHAPTKLMEAEEALGKMKWAVAYDAPIVRRQEFLPYLKQLLGVCYSVTLSLDQTKKGWRQNLNPDEAELNTFMLTQRHSEVHNTGAVGLRQEIKWYPASRFKEVTIIGPPALLNSGAPNPNPVGLTEHYFEMRSGREEIIPTCEKYLTVLARLI